MMIFSFSLLSGNIYPTSLSYTHVSQTRNVLIDYHTFCCFIVEEQNVKLENIESQKEN